MLRIVIFIQLNLLLIFTVKVQAETLNIASDIWCPYVCDNKEAPGVLVEVLREVAKVKKIQMRFEVIPLSRSLIMARRSKVDLVLAITAEHILEYKLQRSTLSYGGWRNDFYISTKHNWVFNKPQDIEFFLKAGESLGLIKGYEYGPFVDKLKLKYAANIYQSTGNSPLANIIEMLQKGRITALLDSRFNVEYEMKKNNHDDIMYAGSEGGFVPLFLGYSPTISSKTINTIDAGLVFIRNKGILKGILEKYGISDWQQPLNLKGDK